MAYFRAACRWFFVAYFGVEVGDRVLFLLAKVRGTGYLGSEDDFEGFYLGKKFFLIFRGDTW